MSSQTLKELNRRNPDLRFDDVDMVLPRYFEDEYPNIISFLRAYYDATDDNTLTNFFRDEMFALRDLDETSLGYIDRLFYEIGNNASADYFSDPRFVGKLLSFMIKNRGNEFSAQLFFRLFFDEEPTIQYPKDNMFIVAQSPLNDPFYVVQDGAKYQFLSVLIKSGRPISEWSALYRRFVHSAGYYLSGEVLLEGVGYLSLSAPVAILDSDAGTITLEQISGGLGLNAIGEMQLLFDSGDTTFVMSDTMTLGELADVPIGSLDDQYEDLRTLGQEASPRMSEDSDGSAKSPATSSTIETMDRGYSVISYVDSA